MIEPKNRISCIVEGKQGHLSKFFQRENRSAKFLQNKLQCYLRLKMKMKEEDEMMQNFCLNQKAGGGQILTS